MDWNKVATLLHIADKSNQWPDLHELRNRALAELKRLHEDTKEVVAKAEAKVEPVKEKFEADFSKLKERFNTPGSKAEVE